MDPDVVYLVSSLRLSKLHIMDNGGTILILEAQLQSGEYGPDGPPQNIQLGLHRLHAESLGTALLESVGNMDPADDPQDVVILDDNDIQSI